MLAAIGIVKGQPFNPDANDTGNSRSRGEDRLQDQPRHRLRGGRQRPLFPRLSEPPLGQSRRRRHARESRGPFDLAWRRTDGRYLDLDARIWFFTDYYSISPGMISQVPGKGAKYMVGFTDSAGTPLSGGTNYRLKLPPNIPAANFWSLTLYEAENASGYANGQPFPSLGSRDNPAQNADGSTDLYIGPQAPAGKERNWMRTIPGKGFFAILRLYAPTEPAINKTWIPNDIERVN